MSHDRHTRSLMHRVRQIHFVGIGGAGMSGIAEVLINLGFAVSGSDLQDSDATRRLQKLGATVHLGHAGEHLGAADVVVVSGAVPENNPEVLAARERRVPVVARAEMLGELMRFRQGIAVAGTHGKTTTTSLVASLLAEADLDPTFVVGGLVNAFGSSARLGQGRYLVAEADESDGSFLKLQPVISVVTNIDRDHLDAYQGSFDQLQRAFLEFLHHLPFFGVAVLCIDDAHVAELLPDVGRTVVTYGLDESADVRGSGLRQNGRHMTFDLWLPGSGQPLAVSLSQPGRHNVQNAIGAAAVAWELGIEPERIVRGLERFGGIGRRFAEIGTLDVGGRQVLASRTTVIILPSSTRSSGLLARVGRIAALCCSSSHIATPALEINSTSSRACSPRSTRWYWPISIRLENPRWLALIPMHWRERSGVVAMSFCSGSERLGKLPKRSVKCSPTAIFCWSWVPATWVGSVHCCAGSTQEGKHEPA
jgi:UDP-N-acetylmuramate--alanine ligase